jgi:toxin-antitoxin system PIN domain toxin
MNKVSSELLLLDVNVLLALAWPNHQFHEAATRRLESSRGRWATCALTQLGFIRLSSNPAAVPGAKTPAEAATLLAAMVKDPLHVYLASLSAPCDEASIQVFERILGSKQVTDAYLLRLARQHRARLTTFDSKLRALATEEDDLEVLRE